MENNFTQPSSTIYLVSFATHLTQDGFKHTYYNQSKFRCDKIAHSKK